MDGELPSADDEIAIDRMYADNNKLKVGDSLTVGGKKLKITGSCCTFRLQRTVF